VILFWSLFKYVKHTGTMLHILIQAASFFKLYLEVMESKLYSVVCVDYVGAHSFFLPTKMHTIKHYIHDLYISYSPLESVQYISTQSHKL